MPANKNAQIRYKILDECFSNIKKEYTFGELLKKVQDVLWDSYGTTVSERQIRDDIKYMREIYSAKIKAYRFAGSHDCYYRYENTDFSIYKNKLTDEEFSKLRSAIDILKNYKGIPANVWLEEVISSLEYRFGVNAHTENILSFDQNEQLKGLKYLSELIDATAKHKPVRIKYRTYKGKEINTVIHPYHIKQYNNRWFLFGLEEHIKFGNRIINRALDRIEGIAYVNNTYIPNDSVDFKEYFNDIVGVTKPQQAPVEIVLRFEKERLPYVISKPIHHTQKVIDQEKGIISITVCPNKELEQNIFSFGPEAEVIEPAWFREQITAKAAEIYKIYFQMQKDCTEGM